MPERKSLNEDLLYRGSSANLPRLHTFENKSRFGILVNLPSQYLVNSILSIDVNLTITTSLGQSGPGSNGYEGVLQIPQSLRTGISPSDAVLSYPRLSLWVFYPSAEVQSIYSTAPADWVQNLTIVH